MEKPEYERKIEEIFNQIKPVKPILKLKSRYDGTRLCIVDQSEITINVSEDSNKFYTNLVKRHRNTNYNNIDRLHILNKEETTKKNKCV
jgi:hypothetical protein